MAFGDERSRIAHLLRRAGFGASAAELDAAVSRGFDATLELLLNPQDDHDAAEDALAQISFDLSKLEDLQRWWIVRMRYTSRPLVEKMTLFWHNHFATAASKVGGMQLPLMKQQNDLFRAQGLGGFRDLLLNVSKDPAMLIWLDGRQNHKKAPNENYGRELMELFTMGVGNYTEDDVKAAAHAFTGWGLDKNYQFAFTAGDHDNGVKNFLGQTGDLNGDDIVNILVQRPATATFLATKLGRFFLSDQPDTAFVADLAATYTNSGYDMKSVMRRLFKSDAFSSQAAYHALIKSPAEYLVGTLRTLNIGTNGLGLPAVMRGMGQELFNPPNVAGWPGGAAWIATNTVLVRDNLANLIATSTKPGAGLYVDTSALVNASGSATATDVVDALAAVTLDADLSATERDRLIAYAGGAGAGFDFSSQDLKLRGILYLLLSMPEFSLN